MEIHNIVGAVLTRLLWDSEKKNTIQSNQSNHDTTSSSKNGDRTYFQ